MDSLNNENKPIAVGPNAVSYPVAVSYVINLKRRTDRLYNFKINYENLGPELPLEVIEAIDGTDLNSVKNNEFLNKTSEENDYKGNPRVRATILSHMKAWSKIAQGDSPVGLIFEDDIFFREDCKFKSLFPKMLQKLPPKFKNDISIIYFGCGDFLPIHTEPPTESLLRAQEKSHVSLQMNQFFGKPKMGSGYIFDWFGAFSYMISKGTAKYLLDLAESKPLNKAVDVWLKDIFDSGNYRYATVPLLTYHGSYDLNVYDSDTWGVSVPMKTEKEDTEINTTNHENEKLSITFLIPTRSYNEKDIEDSNNIINEFNSKSEDLTDYTDLLKRKPQDPKNVSNDEKKKQLSRSESLRNVLLSILDKKDNENVKISFMIRYDTDDDITENFLENFSKERPDAFIIKIKRDRVGRLGMHTMYNEMFKESLKNTENDTGEMFAIWNDDTEMTTDGWDSLLQRYYRILLNNSPESIACFQLRTNETWAFVNPILTRKMVSLISEIPTPSIYGFLKYVGYLSRTNIFVRDISIEKIFSDHHYYKKETIDEINNSLRFSEKVKEKLTNILENIKKDKDYKACGIWVSEPDNWESDKIIGENVLSVFNREVN